MPRQIVPVTDVAAILLTQDEGDLRYLPITYSPPPVDLSLYYTKVQSDARFQPVGNYQPAGSYSLTSHNHDTSYSLLAHNHDAAYLPLSHAPGTDPHTQYLNNTRGDARYSLTAHNHSGVYQPVGSYLTQATADPLYVNVSGDTMAGALVVNGGSVSVNHTSAEAALVVNSATGNANILWATQGTSRWGVFASVNAWSLYQYASGINRISVDSNGQLNLNSAAACIQANSNILVTGAESQPEAVRLGSAYSLPGVYSSNRMNVLSEGPMVVRAMGGTTTIQAYSSITLINSVGDITVNPASGVFVPAADNAKACGWTTARWSTVHAANGSIQTSHATSKKNLTPLDPAACTAAVLETDWLSFEYIPPPAPPPQEGQPPKERLAVLDEYLAKTQETLVFRKQNGYVLGHETHKTHDLFGLADRQSASPSADLGILACALQAALKRIAALEGVPSE